jgi:hypothetical protein
LDVDGRVADDTLEGAAEEAAAVAADAMVTKMG